MVGAGEAGARLTLELARSRQWRVVGVLDDDPRSRDGDDNVGALGPIASPPAWAKEWRAQGDHRIALCSARSVSPRRADLRGERAQARRCRPTNRPSAAIRSSRRSARSSPTTSWAATRSSSTAKGWPNGRQSRRRWSRAWWSIGAVSAGTSGVLPSGEAVLFDLSRPRRPVSDVARRCVSAAAGRGHRRRRQARGAGRRGALCASWPSVASTPARTSTCR